MKKTQVLPIGLGSKQIPSNLTCRLQRRIFTRWVNQKLAKRGIKIMDVVRDMADGVVLINLLEVLTEKPYTGKYDKQPKSRPKKMENANFALQVT
jgi:hypothetical protein